MEATERAEPRQARNLYVQVQNRFRLAPTGLPNSGTLLMIAKAAQDFTLGSKPIFLVEARDAASLLV